MGCTGSGWALGKQNHDIKQRHGAEKGIPTEHMHRFKGPDTEPFSKCIIEHHVGDRVTNQRQIMAPHEAPTLGEEASMYHNNENNSVHLPTIYFAGHFP